MQIACCVQRIPCYVFFRSNLATLAIAQTPTIKWCKLAITHGRRRRSEDEAKVEAITPVQEEEEAKVEAITSVA